MLPPNLSRHGGGVWGGRARADEACEQNQEIVSGGASIHSFPCGRKAMD